MVGWLARRWRYVGYVAFVSIRLWGMQRDQLFPIWDGLTYYMKSAWMASDPLNRAMPWQAFSYMPIRPPGPMWMLLPGMALQPSFTVFAASLLVWIVLLIEVGICGLFDGKMRLARDPMAILLLFGIGSFFVGSELFIMDGLFTAQTIAAIGLGAAWLKRPRLLIAMAFGVCLACALWTKPAGAFVIASVGSSLAIGYALKRLHFSSQRVSLPQHGLLHLLCISLPVCTAFATFFFTPYSTVLNEFRTPMMTATLARSDIDDIYSFQSFLHLLRLITEDVGIPLILLVCLLDMKVLLFDAPWRDRRWPLFAYTLALTLEMFIVFNFVPLKQHRYFAPVSAALLCWHGIALTLERCSKRYVLGVCAAFAIGWRVLCIGDTLPYRPWLRGPNFGFPMTPLRDFTKSIDKQVQIGVGNSSRVIFTDAMPEFAALWSMLQTHDVETNFTIHGP